MFVAQTLRSFGLTDAPKLYNKPFFHRSVVVYDFAHWKQIGNVLSRQERLPALSIIHTTTGGNWAATIRRVSVTMNSDQLIHMYAHYCLNGITSFANNGNGWSNRVRFTLPCYDYRSVLGRQRYCQFVIDLKTGESLSKGTVTIWTRTEIMGGTGVGHMVTMARAKNITGPYIPYANTTDYLQTVGHADLFQDTAGNWWAVALAARNATVNYPMGRETVLVPVVWEEIFNGGTPDGYTFKRAVLFHSKPTISSTSGPLVGHIQKIDFLPGVLLPRQLFYYRYPDFSRFEVSSPGHEGTLSILGSAVNITGGGGDETSTFIAWRQDALEFTVSATLVFAPDLQNADVEGEEVGLTLFIHRVQHFDLRVVALSDAGSGTVVGCGAARDMSGGFTESRAGMYATGNGTKSTTSAYFNNFIYDPARGIY
ncbi:hypothetical protein M0805_002778 [Coniferiporia weirii]|nr:hypothetical protein M0805_002778 [Coniferiporia weirii]